MLRARNMQFPRFRNHARIKGLMICDLTLTGLREATGILNRSSIKLLLLLSIPSKLITSSEFRILVLLKEMLLRCIFSIYGRLTAKLSVILVHKVFLLTFEVSVGRGQALWRVVRKPTEI